MRLKENLMKPCVFLGVDLVEMEKAEKFYRAHGDRIGELFHPEETAYIRQSRNPHRALATVLAAKEAVFKALPLSWTGLSGFRAIRIVPRPRGIFSFRLEGRSGKTPKALPRLKLFCRQYGRFVLAQCGPEFGACAGN
jgi:phosphopantetheine--protein transferase-like protein